VRTHYDLAKGLGQKLGIGAVLFRRLPREEIDYQSDTASACEFRVFT
jgi:hypothetical protein